MDDRFRELKVATAAALLRGPGATPAELRQACARGDAPGELQALVATIDRRPSEVTDGDLAALREKYSEDELFEIIVAAAFGAADRRLEAGLRALEEA
jgi:alkylhydroperoxidase/carboxymuconolactone decarboxylase family protein YurZ